MNIFAFATEGPIVGHDDVYNTTITGRRWAFVTHWCNVGFEFQIRWRDHGWRAGGEYFYAGIETRPSLWFRLGHKMMEYEGEHHAIYGGPFYLNWCR